MRSSSSSRPAKLVAAVALSRRVPARLPCPPARRPVVCRAGFPNPFHDEKADAAKRALEAAFQGKADVLAVNDRKGGGGGGAGGRGGFGAGGGGDDDGGAGRRKALREGMETLKAIFFVVAGLTLFSSWRQLFALAVNAVFVVLRIPRESALPAAAAGATPTQVVVSRWAAADDDV